MNWLRSFARRQKSFQRARRVLLRADWSQIRFSGNNLEDFAKRRAACAMDFRRRKFRSDKRRKYEGTYSPR
jgi:hypothetical protein